jgi:chromate transporter
VTLAEATLVWAKIGLLSFGGPAGQIALMHRILVDEKRWIDETRFLHALNFCMLLPGPEAQQLATYVGWLLHRVRGGLIAGTLFILPGCVVILGLSFLYVSAGNFALVQGLFTGLKAAVIVIVLQAVIRIGRRSLRSAAPIAIAVIAFLAMFLWRVPFPYVVLSAAVAGAVVSRRRHQLLPGAGEDMRLDASGEPVVSVGYLTRCVLTCGLLWLMPTMILAATAGADSAYPDIAVFFSKMAVVTFGGAYAVLAYVSQEAVLTYHWLLPGEMIDGLALAETTPGPLIMVTQFVGFLAAYRNPGALPAGFGAVLGALLTTWVTFMPCFMWIFVGAPYMERLRGNRILTSALSGVTAAVVGVVANLAVWFTIHALFARHSIGHLAGAVLEVPVWSSLQVPTVAVVGVAAMLLWWWRMPVPGTLAVAGLAGAGLTLL